MRQQVEETFKSNDVQIVSIDYKDQTKYLPEASTLVLEIEVSSFGNIDEYIKSNQEYCDGLSSEDAPLAGDCHRLTEVGKKMISENNFVEAHESGGGGSTASLDFLAMHNKKVYQFSCNPSNKEEFSLLADGSLESISAFEKTQTFISCIDAIKNFKFF